MSHSKQTQPKKNFSLYIHNWNKNAKKYINTCNICGSKGYSLVILEPSFQDQNIPSENRAIYNELIKILKPLELDYLGRCDDCARIHDNSFNLKDLKKEKLKLPMDEFRISIISSCNMRCYYCHNEGNNTINKLSIDDIELLIKNASDFNLKSIRLTGGEPMIHDDIFNICKLIKKKYDLKIGINTNGIELEKIVNLIKCGFIDRIVVGIDYYDNKISKNSLVGLCSKEILNNIIVIKNYGIDVSISTVYDGDYENLKLLTNWAITNGIKIKILEAVDNIISNNSSEAYIDARNRIIKYFNLETKVDSIFNEVHGYINNNKVVSFFHSHCRIRECKVCEKMHLRVTSDGKLKPCLLNSDTEIYYKNGNVKQNIIKSIKMLGIPPK